MASQSRNGRVDTIEEDNFAAYNLFQEERKNTDFKTEALCGIFQDNQLAHVFFSRENIDALQQGIRYMVYKKTCGKHTIGNQSETELQIVMRSIYLQHASHKPYGILEQVRELNTYVIEYCVQKIVEEINIYMHYKKDISALPVPMDRGEFISSKGTKVLETRQF